MVAQFAAVARTARSLAFVALLAPALGACAYGVGDLFGETPPPPPPPVFVPKTQSEGQASGTSGEGAAAQTAEAQESFPTLSEVPERPAPQTPAAEQQAISQSLAADRQNAQYTRERLTGEMTDGGEPPPPASASRASPADPATPSTATATAAADAPAPTQDGDGQAAPQPAPASAAAMVPPPPSAGGSEVAADESDNVQRAIDSRSALTEGTTRGSAMQDRSAEPVLQRTERLTAALNAPETSVAEVDAFTRRMAAQSPAARAASPGPGGAAAAAMAPASAMAGPVPASRQADELLAARASAELAAYEGQAGPPPEPERPAATRQAAAAVPATDETPAPKLTTTTTEIAEIPATTEAAGTSDIEAATLRAIERQAAIEREAAARRSGGAMTEQVTMTEARSETPDGRVTTVETMTETVVPAPQIAVQPVIAPAPPPQTLAEIYEAQLRASSATTLQQAAQAGAGLAATDAAPSYPRTAAAAMPQSMPASYASPAMPQGYPQQAAYGAGTVVIDGNGSTAMVQPAGPAAGQAVAGTGQAPGVKAGTVRFAVGSSRLGGGDLETLRRIAQQYRELGGRVLVVGHASSRTADMPPDQHKIVNFDMSLERAEAVAAQLGRYGIPAAAILVEARADMDPIYFEAMPAAETANRRAEIFFLR